MGSRPYVLAALEARALIRYCADLEESASVYFETLRLVVDKMAKKEEPRG